MKTTQLKMKNFNVLVKKMKNKKKITQLKMKKLSVLLISVRRLSENNRKNNKTQYKVKTENI